MSLAAVVASRSSQQISANSISIVNLQRCQSERTNHYSSTAFRRGYWFIYEKETEEKNRSPLLFSHLTNSNSNFHRIEMNWIEFKTSGVSAMTSHYISALIFMKSWRFLTTCRPSLFHSEKHPYHAVCRFSTCGQLRVGTPFYSNRKILHKVFEMKKRKKRNRWKT